MKERFSILDILKIEAITAVILYHIGLLARIQSLSIIGSLGPLYLSLGQIGVYAFIFVSGATLASNHPTTEVMQDLPQFYIMRFKRIYPPYWIALLFALVLLPSTISKITPDILPLIISGFTAFAGKWDGPIESGFWFIGVIVSLYLLYPFISKFIDWNPVWAIVILAEISIISMVLAQNWDTVRWSPLCNIIFFAAGIFCVRTGGIPQWKINSQILIQLSELSFFIYLYNYILGYITSVSIAFYLTAVIGISTAAMIFDQKIFEMNHT